MLPIENISAAIPYGFYSTTSGAILPNEPKLNLSV